MKNLMRHSPILLAGCILIAASRLHAQPANLVLHDTTIAGVATFIATNSITAGPNFTIALTGDATFRTGRIIYLRNGIVVVSGGRFRAVQDSTLVDVKLDEDPLIPAEFALRQNYPNPFNPTTTINFDLPHRSTVALSIFNMLGQRVATLVNEDKDAGRYEVVWDGRHDQGIQVSSGVYFYRLTADQFVETRKMLFMK